MESIVLSKVGEELVISKLNVVRPFYFEITLIYPYEGQTNAYYDETADFTQAELHAEKFRQTTAAIYRAYQTLDKHFEKILQEFRAVYPDYRHSPLLRYHYLESQENLKTYFLNLVLEGIPREHLSWEAQQLILKSIMHLIIHQTRNYRTKKPENLVWQLYFHVNRTKDHNAESGSTLFQDLPFRLLLPHGMVALKISDEISHTEEFIVNCVRAVPPEAYFEQQPGVLPFLLRDTRLGIRPHLTTEFLARLEGQQVAVLTKDGLDRQDFSLDLYRVTKGALHPHFSFNHLYQEEQQETEQRFKALSDKEKKELFLKMADGAPTEYEVLLKEWWMNRF